MENSNENNKLYTKILPIDHSLSHCFKARFIYYTVIVHLMDDKVHLSTSSLLIVQTATLCTALDTIVFSHNSNLATSHHRHKLIH